MKEMTTKERMSVSGPGASRELTEVAGSQKVPHLGSLGAVWHTVWLAVWENSRAASGESLGATLRLTRHLRHKNRSANVSRLAPRFISRRLSARSACHPAPPCSPSQPFYSSSQPLCSLVAPSLLAITSNHTLHMHMSTQDSLGTSSLPSLPVCTSNNLPQPTPCPTIGDLLSALSKHAELANMSYLALDMFTCCANQLKNDILLPQPQSISHLEPPLVLPPSIAGFLANVSGILPALVDCLWVIV